jgi:hypothetical protein
VRKAAAVASAPASRRRLLPPLALTKFIASFARSNMNVAINSTAMGALAILALAGLGAAMLVPRSPELPTVPAASPGPHQLDVSAERT